MKTIKLALSMAMLVAVILHKPIHAQAVETDVSLTTQSGSLAGTFLNAQAAHSNQNIVALIIAGSGPTDRNGNNPMMQNNSLKMLAEGLAEAGISSLRYDKRGVAASVSAAVSEQDLRFEHYINDAKAWLDYAQSTLKADKIMVIGHSEGALIGAVAAQQANVDLFVSIAGAGRAIDKVLREQLAAQPPVVLEAATPILDSLLAGKTVDDVPAYLNAVFRPSVQPYMISWFKYTPTDEIAKLNKPILVVQGTTDIQVSVEDAKALADANKRATLVTIDKMNHIFKQAEADRQANITTYSQPDLPIKKELINAIESFVFSS